ncbi:SGNH/GDSL hydrolase family protein [Brevibacillus sp. SYSU BS000544]|uniref:SGNH/GDSL hydrolase family protein n=1 Tax=Brevibacillus sp. SYSU BS000544 TaxID=3416443 RepID=UPI003CE50196
MWNRFVAIGDSVTKGIGDEVNNIPCRSWADHLALEWQNKNTSFYYENLAIRGLTAAEVRETQLEKAVSLQPDIVSVVAGGNDVLKSVWNPTIFEREFTFMLERLSQTGATIISSTVPDFPVLRKLPDQKAEQVRIQLQELNELIRKSCEKYTILCSDIWRAPFTMDHSGWSEDGIHPNSIGYMQLAQFIKEDLLNKIRR